MPHVGAAGAGWILNRASWGRNPPSNFRLRAPTSLASAAARGWHAKAAVQEEGSAPPSHQQQQPHQQLPRFFVAEQLRGRPAGWLVSLDVAESRHTKTLRMLEGSRLELCDGRGSIVLAEVAGVGRQGATVRTLAEPAQAPLRGWQWQVAVACGSLKGGRADYLVEKCVELGAEGFIPLLTQRSPVIGSSGSSSPSSSSSSSKQGRRGTEKRKQGGGRAGAAHSQQDENEGDGWWDEEGGGREGRWQRVATAALKQSLRAHAMRVYPPCSVQDLCLRVKAADAALVGVAGAPPLPQRAAGLAGLHPAGGPRDGRDSEQQQQLSSLHLPPGVRRGLLVIGPEGDFTPGELEQLLVAGAAPVGLGDLRLRAETAAVALLAYLRLHLDGGGSS